MDDDGFVLDLASFVVIRFYIYLYIFIGKFY